MKRELGKPLVSGQFHTTISAGFLYGPGKRMNHSEGLAFLIGGSGVGLKSRTSSSQLLARRESTSSLPFGLGAITGCPVAAAEQALPCECAASDRLALRQAPWRILCEPSDPTWPTRATLQPALPLKSSPARPQCSVPCICPRASCIDRRARSLGLRRVCLWYCCGRRIVSLPMHSMPREEPMPRAQAGPCGNSGVIAGPLIGPLHPTFELRAALGIGRWSCSRRSSRLHP